MFLILIILIVVAGVLFYTTSSFVGKQYAAASAENPAPSALGTTTTAMKLIDEPYYKFVYEIDPNELHNLSPTMQQVLSGFNVTAENNPDGTVTVSLDALNLEYHNQTYILKQGQKLYFIEKSLDDDKEIGNNFPGDDTAVVVDESGYVIQSGS
jgi:hypothetical protein